MKLYIFFGPPFIFVAEDGEGAEPLDDDKGRSSHLVLPASTVEYLIVVTGGDGDGDKVLVLIPVSSTPVVVGGLVKNGDDAGLLDDEGHDSHLVVGGLVGATGGCVATGREKFLWIVEIFSL